MTAWFDLIDVNESTSCDINVTVVIHACGTFKLVNRLIPPEVYFRVPWAVNMHISVGVQLQQGGIDELI